MRLAVRVLSLALATFASQGPTTVQSLPGVPSRAFEAFKIEHNRHYGSSDEETKRFAIFLENMNAIEQLNSQQLPYSVGMNQALLVQCPQCVSPPLRSSVT